MSMLFLFNCLSCLVITFVTPTCILELVTSCFCVAWQETQAQTICNTGLESDASDVQKSVGNSECSRSCSSSKISFVVGTQKVTWSEAFVLCKQAGMELASVNSIDEENILENYTRTLNSKVGYHDGYWIAGTRNGACSSDFVWFTTGKPVIYRKFSSGQPDNSRGNESCLELFLNRPNNWAWNDAPCDLKLAFICQSFNCL